MRDLFAPKINGHHYLEDPFRYICGVFSGDGATQVIIRATKHELKTFYPIRRNLQGEYKPLWRSYLFIEHREGVTIDLCRTTSNFIKIVSEKDEDGLLRPILVRREAISESLKLVTHGKFDDQVILRRFYGRGSIVRVIDGSFAEKRVKLEVDVTPQMKGNAKIPVSIDNIKAVIELHKLSL